MINKNIKHSYNTVLCGFSDLKSEKTNSFGQGECVNADGGFGVEMCNVSDRISKDAHVSMRKLVAGPYEIMDVISSDLDKELDSRFRDKAIYIKAIAKVRAATDVDIKEFASVLSSSTFSPLFESFDLDGFFSSLDVKEIHCFLQEHSTTACSFISSISSVDLRNRAIVEVRSKLNNLNCSIRAEGRKDIWSFLNLLSILYYSDIIKFIKSKMAYADCYACKLFEIASSLFSVKDGSGEGRIIAFCSLKDRKFLEALDVLKMEYA